MKQFGKVLLLTMGFGVLAAVLSFLTNGHLGAQGPPGGLNVRITNPASSPVLVRDVENPARQPFQIGFPFTMNSGTTQVFQSFTVPAGKRLVIEYVSMGSGAVPVGQHLFIILFTSVGAGGAFHYVAVTPQGRVPPPNEADTFVASQPMRVYADPGTTVSIQMGRDSGVGACDPGLTVSGYLVDVT